MKHGLKNKKKNGKKTETDLSEVLSEVSIKSLIPFEKRDRVKQEELRKWCYSPNDIGTKETIPNYVTTEERIKDLFKKKKEHLSDLEKNFSS